MKLEGEKVIYEDVDFTFIENEEKELESIVEKVFHFGKRLL